MTDGEERDTRRARNFVYALGALFALLGFALDYIPLLHEYAAANSGRICAGLGTVLLVAARFGSDRLIRRCESLLSGWP